MTKTKIDRSKKGEVVACPPKAAASDPATDSKNTLIIKEVPGEDPELTLVKARLHPVVSAATTARHFEKSLADSDFKALTVELSRHVNDVKAGNMNRPEAILLTQAQTLDVIFNALAQRAGANVGKQMDTAEIYLRMALKAQSQCRATLETLAEIKAPKSMQFIKQQNVANQQQVNNGGITNGATAPAHEKNITPNQSNELLEASHGERMDTRAAGAAGSIDSQLATVAPVKRRQNARRQNSELQERA